MKIKVLLFGIVKDIVGENTIDLDLGPTISINDFQQIMRNKFAGLKDIENFAIAVNEEYVNRDYKIKNNDVVAIIPPVSGG
jgi:molybdopterin converting factor subunit 1